MKKREEGPVLPRALVIVNTKTVFRGGDMGGLNPPRNIFLINRDFCYRRSQY